MKSLSIFKPALGAILILGFTIMIMGCAGDAPPAQSPDDLPPTEPTTNSPDTSGKPAE